MCIHKHTTEVSTLTELGLITIHQCDMCGVCVPRKPVSGQTAIRFDERAARVGYRRQYEMIERMARDGCVV